MAGRRRGMGTESAKIALFRRDVVRKIGSLLDNWKLCRPTHSEGPIPSAARKGVVEDARERIGDEHADERHCGRCVKQAPQPLRAMGPAPHSGCLRRGQGFSALRPLSTFCIALSGVVLPEERGLELLVVEQRDLQRHDAVKQRNLRLADSFRKFERLRNRGCRLVRGQRSESPLARSAPPFLSTAILMNSPCPVRVACVLGDHPVVERVGVRPWDGAPTADGRARDSCGAPFQSP